MVYWFFQIYLFNAIVFKAVVHCTVTGNNAKKPLLSEAALPFAQRKQAAMQLYVAKEKLVIIESPLGRLFKQGALIGMDDWRNRQLKKRNEALLKLRQLQVLSFRLISYILVLPAIVMRAIQLYSFFILTVAFLACKTQLHETKSKDFTTETKSFQADTVLTSAVYLNGHIICLQADSKIFVLDTLLHKDSSLTAKFSNIQAAFLHSFSDTILVGTRDSLYFIDTDLTLKNYSRRPFKYGLPYYNDDMYYVHACSIGEFGGAVFFWNKRTGKTYSYPATAVQQVLKFGDTYVVSNFLAHMSGFSDYLFIKDPTKLYELKDEKQKNFCNWYVEVDSLKNKRFSDTTMPPSVKFYSDTFTTRTLTTFPHNNKLYSIYCTDSTTILAKFQNSKLIPVDTLLRHRLYFQNAKTHLTDDAVVTTYEATWAVGGEGNSWIPYQNTGLIFIRNSKITFLEFKTPHMPTNNSR